MLVLSRHVGQEIVIGGNICIRVLSVQGNKVRLAVAAPREVTVDRREVHERRCEFDHPLPIALEDRLSTAYPRG